MRTKKLFVLLLAVVLSAGLMLSACGGEGDKTPEGKVIITFAGRGTTDEEKNYNTFLDGFMKDNPNIIVKPI